MVDSVVPDPRLFPFTSRWFSSSVGRVHYVDEGDGPAIVFLHGSPTWSFVYRHVISRLRDRFRCVAIDYPGFGLSSRPAGFGYTIAELTGVVGELIDHLELDEFVVMGQDWGGPIGLGCAVPRADRVRGVALGNTALWPIDAAANRAFSAIMSSRPMQRRILEKNILVKKFLLGRAGPRLSDDEADQYRLVQATPQDRVALAVMPREIRAARPLLARLEQEIPEVLANKPAVVVWGMRDMVFRASQCLPRIRSMFTDSTVIEVAHAGHFIQEDAPDDIADALASRFS